MNNLILIGLPGSGKTTVGQLLAHRLRLPFHDCDAAIEASAGCSVSRIFAAEGEESFRRRESACLAALCRGEGQVIAVGGGAVLRPENRAAMTEGSLVVFLDRDVDEIMSTISAADRPLLAGDDVRQTLLRLQAERQVLYQTCAALTVCAQTAQDAAQMIADYWEGKI